MMGWSAVLLAGAAFAAPLSHQYQLAAPAGAAAQVEFIDIGSLAPAHGGFQRIRVLTVYGAEARPAANAAYADVDLLVSCATGEVAPEAAILHARDGSIVASAFTATPERRARLLRLTAGASSAVRQAELDAACGQALPAAAPWAPSHEEAIALAHKVLASEG